MSRQNTAPWEDCPLAHAGVPHDAKSKRCKRRRGRIEYMAVGAVVDHSYRRHYNFSTYRIVLARQTHPTETRPIGSTTTVGLDDYRYNFEAV